eukprot:CAMPEP_0195078458 /NCGR_PEP_ID=MMETSP0448-20130528/20643_1 /TAXON_ID=66468 /ORGANISM="Heterocapsa triquestra, Strain CCMP 448" /LENGTH=42 /DNA_ID= /DNA_START= /DNA_END= /DNA_ORIENTATION=
MTMAPVLAASLEPRLEYPLRVGEPARQLPPWSQSSLGVLQSA